MLQRIFIENFALIEKLEIEWSSGFNVMTGETGAGKSIVIDALNLVLGERANREMIRHGAKKARAEAIFDIQNNLAAKQMLEDLGLDAADEVILSREITVTHYGNFP